MSKLKATQHVKRMYNLAFPLNATLITLKRKRQEGGGNYGDVAIDTPDIIYTFELNINPMVRKTYNVSKEGIARDFTHAIMSNPELYPQTGVTDDEDSDVVEIPLVSIRPTDTIVFEGAEYILSDQFESISFNDSDLLWQSFYAKVLSEQ